ncbi:hypothetical protein F751_2067 [Auxenochlorella protothecoides]|uniref:Uncharacterized protein n=1 Tax=Auxenochlorella protothecoides TaxID=3075 RepID=A0A087SMM7_AUXPR|nr:hypothetical protein F751_2067 [Auxenochlorella protothecoides]KFM26981.1 hypothetical protein F751_2067 [Auxenochlorella protothecoides]
MRLGASRVPQPTILLAEDGVEIQRAVFPTSSNGSDDGHRWPCLGEILLQGVRGAEWRLRGRLTSRASTFLLHLDHRCNWCPTPQMPTQLLVSAQCRQQPETSEDSARDTSVPQDPAGRRRVQACMRRLQTGSQSRGPILARHPHPLRSRKCSACSHHGCIGLNGSIRDLIEEVFEHELRLSLRALPTG